MRLCSVASLSEHREAMPNQSPAQLANLRPFPKGYRAPKKADSAKTRTLHGAKLASPECLEFALSVMRDDEERTETRLRAMEAVLRVAFPPKSLQLDEAQTASAMRYLEVVFVRPGEQPQVSNGKIIDAPSNSFAVSFDAGK